MMKQCDRIQRTQHSGIVHPIFNLHAVLKELDFTPGIESIKGSGTCTSTHKHKQQAQSSSNHRTVPTWDGPSLYGRHDDRHDRRDRAALGNGRSDVDG